jgi:hypothetical protein
MRKKWKYQGVSKITWLSILFESLQSCNNNAMSYCKIVRKDIRAVRIVSFFSIALQDGFLTP